MKCFHLSDLHIGRRINGFSMLEDQKHILQSILNMIDSEQPDAIFIAGDVYDNATPSAEAVQTLDRFLSALKERDQRVFVISGNHDSQERIAFGNQLMARSGIHMVPVYQGKTTSFSLSDQYGKINIFMLPFLNPTRVRLAFPEEEISTYTDAYRVAIEHMEICPEERNVLIAHAFVTGATRSESEEIFVGGADHVDANVFDGFDYVALGHLHRAQNVGSPRIRYCGAPLKYDFSEASQQKTVTVVELGEKGALSIRELPLIPLHDIRVLRGTYLELAKRQNPQQPNTEDYMRLLLTDEQEVPDALNKLRYAYPNIMKLEYDNTRTRATGQLLISEEVPKLSPQALFADFYKQQNGQPMSEEQQQFLNSLIERIWEGEA